MVPEVGIPSINSEQAHRHGVEAPRDFESIPNHQAISHHFQTLINQRLTRPSLEQLGSIWMVSGLDGYTLVTFFYHRNFERAIAQNR